MTLRIDRAAIAAAADIMRDSSCTAALTGAGISTRSGIPDFRGPNGLWTKDPDAEKLSDIRWYMSDPEIRCKAWKARLAHPVWDAEPNEAHLALVDLERKYQVHGLATQNVDGLHQRAGSSPELVIELHGTIHQVVCMRCGELTPMPETLERVRNGEPDPDCRSCGGILKSATVSFGQTLDPQRVDTAFQVATASDVYMAIGTSLGIYPAAALPEAALSAGSRLIIINEEPTPYDRFADVVIHADAGEALQAIVAAI